MGIYNYIAWVTATPSGYALHIDMYQGKNRFTEDNYMKEFGLGGSVVLESLENLEKAYPSIMFSFFFR